MMSDSCYRAKICRKSSSNSVDAIVQTLGARDLHEVDHERPRLGDSDFKKTDSSPKLLSTPEVKVPWCRFLVESVREPVTESFKCRRCIRCAKG